MTSSRGKNGRGASDPFKISLPRDMDEELASIEGQLASFVLEAMLSPSPERAKAFQRLRCSARLDPIAAYNLGNYMSASVERNSRRRWRQRTALSLFEKSALMGLERLKEPSKAGKFPAREKDLRDIVSRALTNIGAQIANSGYPAKAVEHFRRSALVYPDNANTHTCLGNMGVYFHSETGIDPLEGIKSWERAARLGDYCHESRNGCPCRGNVIRIVRELEKNYGSQVARFWLMERLPNKSKNRSHRDLPSVVIDVRDIERVLGKPWPVNAIDAAEIFSEELSEFRSLPLPIKVTIAASILGVVSRIDARNLPGDPDVLSRAIAAVDDIETLSPFLGDDEWDDLGPPQTLYLSDPKIEESVAWIVEQIVIRLEDQVSELKPVEGVMGLMFCLDKGFRRGVANMVRGYIGQARNSYSYIPALVIGSPSQQ